LTRPERICDPIHSSRQVRMFRADLGNLEKTRTDAGGGRESALIPGVLNRKRLRARPWMQGGI